jgi:hypothetical protein
VAARFAVFLVRSVLASRFPVRVSNDPDESRADSGDDNGMRRGFGVHSGTEAAVGLLRVVVGPESEVRVRALGAGAAVGGHRVPTPLKVPAPQGNPLWSVAMIIGLRALVGGILWMSLVGGALVHRCGVAVPDRDGWRAVGDVVQRDELRATAAQAADSLEENYSWYHPAPETLEADHTAKNRRVRNTL